MTGDERSVSVTVGGSDAAPSGAAERIAVACLRAGVEAVLPRTVVSKRVALEGSVLRVGDDAHDLAGHDRIVVVGGGKATDGVASALESILGDRIDAGLVVVDEAAGSEGADESPIERVVGGHPVPTKAGVDGTARAVELVREAGEKTLVIAAITGGASALFAAPVDAVGLSALRETTDALLGAGADIDEINAVRKHLSRVKGGRLAAAAAPATVVGIAFSDVVGDDPSVIGSGPTVPDETTFADALGVLDRYGVAVPEAVREHLEAEAGGETPGPSDPAFDRVEHHLIADNMTALEGAADAADAAGYEPLILTSRLRGEASEVGKVLVSMGAESGATGTPVEPPAVLLAGGECTVSIDGTGGSGGPNQELALSAALEGEAVVLAAVDTDGEDGSSDAAGAIVDGSTVGEGDREGARAHLDSNDAGTYLAEVGATTETGPTGTNVNDVVVMVVGERSS